MLFRSTGLGKTELKGKIDTIQRQGDYLIMYVDVTDPVKWRIRVALGFRTCTGFPWDKARTISTIRASVVQSPPPITFPALVLASLIPC